MKSLPQQSGTGGGFAVLHGTSQTKTLQFLIKILFLLLLRYVKCVFSMMVIRQCSLVFTVHHLVDRTSKQMQCFGAVFRSVTIMFLCNGLFVVGDLNVHPDKPSGPSTSALNVVLDILSLHQLVKVLTHRRGHTLDWLITNCATDVLDLTVVDMLLSDHFVISFDLSLRKPVREKKKIISRNIRAIDVYAIRTDVHELFGSATQFHSADPLSV